MFSQLINRSRQGQLAALIVTSLCSLPAIAQTTGTSTMTVELVDVLQLTVANSAQLTFNTAANYTNGVTSTVTDQLGVFSSRPYDLKVRAATATLTVSGGSNSIPVENITVEAIGSNIGTATAQTLATTDKTFVSTAPSTLQRNISMKYTTAAANMAFLIPGGNYTTTLTYTIAAK